MASDEQAKRRRECWNQVMRGLGEITDGIKQIVLAVAKYHTGDLTTH